MATPARKAAVLTLSCRLFYSLIAALFSPHLTLNENVIRTNRLTDHLMSRTLHPVAYALMGVWERFDTLWYVEIARHGYDQPMATVYYPLYPFLIRVASLFTRSELVAALVISTAATFFVFWGALRLFEMDGNSAPSFRAIVLWAVWPTSFTFFGGYADSLVCALTVWSLVLARSDRWLWAGWAGFFAGLTKAMGCLVAAPLLWMAWKRQRKEGLAAAGLCFAGVGCYQGWLILQHFPGAGEIYRTYWHIATEAPWTVVIEGIRAAGHNALVLVNLAVLGIAGVAAIRTGVKGAGAAAPDVPAAYSIYAGAALCLFLVRHTEPPLLSTARYSLTLFAAYPVLAIKLGRGLAFAAGLLVFGAVNILLFRVFLEWGLVV